MSGGVFSTLSLNFPETRVSQTNPVTKIQGVAFIPDTTYCLTSFEIVYQIV